MNEMIEFNNNVLNSDSGLKNSLCYCVVQNPAMLASKVEEIVKFGKVKNMMEDESSIIITIDFGSFESQYRFIVEKRDVGFKYHIKDIQITK